jgi:hypothetical protein
MTLRSGGCSTMSQRARFARAAEVALLSRTVTAGLVGRLPRGPIDGSATDIRKPVPCFHGALRTGQPGNDKAEERR